MEIKALHAYPPLLHAVKTGQPRFEYMQFGELACKYTAETALSPKL